MKNEFRIKKNQNINQRQFAAALFRGQIRIVKLDVETLSIRDLAAPAWTLWCRWWLQRRRGGRVHSRAAVCVKIELN